MASQGVGLCCVVAIVTTVGLALYLGQWGVSEVWPGFTMVSLQCSWDVLLVQ